MNLGIHIGSITTGSPPLTQFQITQAFNGVEKLLWYKLFVKFYVDNQSTINNEAYEFLQIRIFWRKLLFSMTFPSPKNHVKGGLLRVGKGWKK